MLDDQCHGILTDVEANWLCPALKCVGNCGPFKKPTIDVLTRCAV
jgi:hypothetical protein